MLTLTTKLGFGCLTILFTSLLTATTSHSQELSPETRVELPRYDNNGRNRGMRETTAQRVWDDMESWEQRMNRKLRNSNQRMKKRRKMNRMARQRIDTLIFPLEPKQKKRLKRQNRRTQRQKINARRRRIPSPPPNPVIVPVKLEQSLASTNGDRGSFAIFRDGEFNTNADAAGVETNQSFSGGGFIFGNRISLVDQKTSTKVERDSRGRRRSETSRTDLKVLGRSVFVSTDGTINSNKQFTRSISKRKVFFLGVPVSVGGSVSGTMGANYSMTTNGVGVRGSVAPFINTGGSLDAGIDVLIANVGVEGSLTFLRSTLTANFEALVDNAQRQVKGLLSVKNDGRILEGRVGVFATIRLLFFSFRAFDITIFNFGGINIADTLIDTQQTIDFD